MNMDVVFMIMIYAIIVIFAFALVKEYYYMKKRASFKWPNLHSQAIPALIKIERGTLVFLVKVYQSDMIVAAVEQDGNKKIMVTEVIPKDNIHFQMHSVSHKTHILEREMVEDFPETWELELARKHLRQWAAERGMDSLVKEI